jgi:hypothetical protein
MTATAAKCSGEFRRMICNLEVRIALTVIRVNGSWLDGGVHQDAGTPTDEVV